MTHALINVPPPPLCHPLLSSLQIEICAHNDTDTRTHVCDTNDNQAFLNLVCVIPLSTCQLHLWLRIQHIQPHCLHAFKKTMFCRSVPFHVNKDTRRFNFKYLLKILSTNSRAKIAKRPSLHKLKMVTPISDIYVCPVSQVGRQGSPTFDQCEFLSIFATIG